MTHLVRCSTGSDSLHCLTVNPLAGPLTLTRGGATLLLSPPSLRLTVLQVLTLGVHHLPLAQSHVVHSVATVGGGEDEPLVDDGAATEPLDSSTSLLPQESEERELSNAGVLSAQDEGGAASLQAALIFLQGGKVAGAVRVRGGSWWWSRDFTADFSPLFVADQRPQFLQQSGSLRSALAQSF